ncbi:MAG: DUF378 domain-containing protein [Alphaproteobacteria bacterium]|nr:DUF378 domain-containing protein [Alphaproteobacteria bacterium]
MNFINKLAYILVIIGGLNWGLIALGNFDLVAFLFGQLSALSRIVYGLVGLSAIWLAIAPFIHDHQDN